MHAQKRRRTRVPPFVVRPPFSPHRCVYDNTCVFIDGELRRCLISNPFDGLFNMCFHSNAIWAFVYCPLFFSFLHSSSLFFSISLLCHRFLRAQLLFSTAHGSKRFSILFISFFFVTEAVDPLLC